MKDLYSVIKKPLLTEKGSVLKESENKILIEVSPDANKVEIKKAIEEIFKVKVEKVWLPSPWVVFRAHQSIWMTSMSIPGMR